MWAYMRCADVNTMLDVGLHTCADQFEVGPVIQDGRYQFGADRTGGPLDDS